MPPKDVGAGSSEYMSTYGKHSTDGSNGKHPRAFHPVGTTELGSLSQNFDTLRSIGCKVVALSVDSVEANKEWLEDVEAYNSTQLGRPVKLRFPIISDGNRAISEAYSMIDQYSMGQQTSTVRYVFVINPENILMLRLDYPSCVGRNMDEIIRCIMALQVSYKHDIQTPAHRPNNTSRLPNSHGHMEEHKGAVFLLPTISDRQAKKRFSKYHTACVPSGKTYLRMIDSSRLNGNFAGGGHVEIQLGGIVGKRSRIKRRWKRSI